MGFETEATAIYDTMNYVGAPVRFVPERASVYHVVGAPTLWLVMRPLLLCPRPASASLARVQRDESFFHYVTLDSSLLPSFVKEYPPPSSAAAQVYTVGIGVALGQACMLLSAGQKGNRYMMPHATAMLHQPRIPSTGQRQAIEARGAAPRPACSVHGQPCRSAHPALHHHAEG